MPHGGGGGHMLGAAFSEGTLNKSITQQNFTILICGGGGWVAVLERVIQCYIQNNIKYVNMREM